MWPSLSFLEGLHEIHVPYETTQAVGFLDCRIALMLHPTLTTGVKLPGGRDSHTGLYRGRPTQVSGLHESIFILCWLLLFCSLLIDILWYLKQQVPRRPSSEFASSIPSLLLITVQVIRLTLLPYLLFL
jgi:hypothetical protein